VGPVPSSGSRTTIARISDGVLKKAQAKSQGGEPKKNDMCTKGESEPRAAAWVRQCHPYPCRSGVIQKFGNNMWVCGYMAVYASYVWKVAQSFGYWKVKSKKPRGRNEEGVLREAKYGVL
jgi:hypothetical protein